MNDPTLELLSRHLDGDLDEAEAQLLAERLAADPALREELEAMAGLRSALSDLAASEEPPGELEVLLEPLRRSPPPEAGTRVRPAFRWLAAAAMAVVAVGVAVQVVRQSPGPNLDRVPTPPAAHREVASGDEANRPGTPPARDSEDKEMLGAVERLLASPVPEPEVEAPRPLEVVGPLSEPVGDEGFAPAPPPSASRSEDEERVVTKVDDGNAAGRREESLEGRAATTLKDERSRRAQAEAEGTGVSAPAEKAGPGKAPATRELADHSASLIVVGKDLRVAVAVGGTGDLPAGRHELRITVVAERVTACTPTEERDLDEASDDLVCRAVAGLEVRGVDDGEHHAILTVR